MTTDPETLGAQFHSAYVDAEPIDPSTLPADTSIEDGYAAQAEFVNRRIDDEGPVVGYKIGFTNEDVQSDFGVDDPVYGRLLRDTVRRDRRFETDGLIEPMVEPEIAFVLGEDLDGSATRLDVLAATRLVVPVLEVVDSRTRDWDVTAATAIADNGLAARLLPGDPGETGSIDLALEGLELLVDGQRRAAGTGAAALGHPADAVAWLAGALDEHGERLRAGNIVTTGTLTDPIPVSAGETVLARFSSLGSVVAQATAEE